MLRHLKDPVEAEKAFRRGMERDESPRAAFNLGVLLEGRGDADGAKEAFQRGVDGRLGMAAVNLGGLLLNEGDLEGAESYFRQAIEMGDATGAINLGLVLSRKGDKQGSATAFEAALESDDPKIIELAESALESLSRGRDPA
jgi:tetratricopeptide (TPR) repeat protein